MLRFARNCAFTIADLAILLVLLALLATLLLPVFEKARQNTANANCVSNLQRIGVAWRQYARDYDGALMRFSTSRDELALPSPTNKTTYWWGSWDKVALKPEEGLLFPYVKTVTLYACPAFHPARGGSQGNLGYGYNAGALSPTEYSADYTVATPVKVSFSDLQEPARTVAFADAAQFAFKNDDKQLRASSYLSPPRASYPNFHGRHEGAGNVLFCDGHVQARIPVYRQGTFGFNYSAARFKAQHLGDIDSDGDLQTNELFVVTKKPVR